MVSGARALGAGTPAWTKHKFRELGFSNQYVDNFSDLVIDVDGDGYPDVASVSWFAKKIAWWRNPGPSTSSGQARSAMWQEAPIHSGFNVEFAILADMNNDGKAHEIVAQENGTGQRGTIACGQSGGARAPSKEGWVRHEVSDRSTATASAPVTSMATSGPTS